MKLPHLVVSVIFTVLGSIATLQAQFVPNVVLLDLAGKQMPDPEFDHFGYQVTWQDENENLWVAPVDRVSGDIEIAKAEMLDTGLAPSAPISSGLATGNGPEWTQSAAGAQILYTLQVGPLGPTNWRVAVARKTGTGWETGPLNAPDGVVGGAPDGTKIPDADPLINFYFQARSGERKLAWLHLNNPEVGGVVPFRFTSPARWALEDRFFVSTVRRNLIDQVVFFDPATPGTYATLTYDRDFSKSKPWMWRAPEFGNEFVFFALENRSGRGPKQIGVYRLIDGEWTKFKTIAPPSGRNFPIVDSAEPFVYKGHSYIVMAMIGRTQSRGSEIWVAGIEGDFYRKVAGPADGVGSTDPEYLILRDAKGNESAVVIYLSQNGGTQVYRASTGL